MCINKIIPWVLGIGIGLLVFFMFGMMIKSCTSDPNIKFGEHVKITEKSSHLNFYDECSGYVQKYNNEGSYRVDAVCTTTHMREGLEVVLTSSHTLKVHKYELKVID